MIPCLSSVPLLTGTVALVRVITESNYWQNLCPVENFSLLLSVPVKRDYLIEEGQSNRIYSLAHQMKSELGKKERK
jgi:hypothetical protein